VEPTESPPVLADVEAAAGRLWAELTPAPAAVTVRHGGIEVRLETAPAPAAAAPAPAPAAPAPAPVAPAPAATGPSPAPAPTAPSPAPPAGPGPAAAAPPAAGPAGNGAAAPVPARHVRAPLVGVFYRTPAPGEPPFVEVGDWIEPGQQVGIIEAMKMMVPVESDTAGRVTEILAEHGEPVEYDRPLVAVAGE
jgi:acetyl-CoA carboxylase biotin carboxyl carrier protein